jgi:hypothetical protein
VDGVRIGPWTTTGGNIVKKNNWVAWASIIVSLTAIGIALFAIVVSGSQ